MSAAGNQQTEDMPLLVTAAVIVVDGKVLITRRPAGKRHAGYWEFPGGKIDPGESPEQALCREIREELDAEILVEGIFDVAYFRYDWGPVLILAYHCRLLSNSLSKRDVDDYSWVSPQDLPQFTILPADQPIVDRLSRQRTIPGAP